MENPRDERISLKVGDDLRLSCSASGFPQVSAVNQSSTLKSFNFLLLSSISQPFLGPTTEALLTAQMYSRKGESVCMTAETTHVKRRTELVLSAKTFLCSSLIHQQSPVDLKTSKFSPVYQKSYSVIRLDILRRTLIGLLIE